MGRGIGEGSYQSLHPMSDSRPLSTGLYPTHTVYYRGTNILSGAAMCLLYLGKWSWNWGEPCKITLQDRIDRVYDLDRRIFHMHEPIMYDRCMLCNVNATAAEKL